MTKGKNSDSERVRSLESSVADDMYQVQFERIKKDPKRALFTKGEVLFPVSQPDPMGALKIRVINAYITERCETPEQQLAVENLIGGMKLESDFKLESSRFSHLFFRLSDKILAQLNQICPFRDKTTEVQRGFTSKLLAATDEDKKSRPPAEKSVKPSRRKTEADFLKPPEDGSTPSPNSPRASAKKSTKPPRKSARPAAGATLARIKLSQVQQPRPALPTAVVESTKIAPTRLPRPAPLPQDILPVIQPTAPVEDTMKKIQESVEAATSTSTDDIDNGW